MSKCREKTPKVREIKGEREREGKCGKERHKVWVRERDRERKKMTKKAM